MRSQTHRLGGLVSLPLELPEVALDQLAALAAIVLATVWSTHDDFLWPMAFIFAGIFVQQGFRWLDRTMWPLSATCVCLHERFVTLGPRAGIASARRLAAFAPRQCVIPVVDEHWRLAGLLDMRTLPSIHDQNSVAEIMRSPVSLTQPLDARVAMELMRSVGLTSIPFVDHRGRIIAVVSLPGEPAIAPDIGWSSEPVPLAATTTSRAPSPV